MRRSWWGWWLGILLLLGGGRVQANPIVPANDGVGTVVNRVGNQFDITGGTRAGANLFHSLLKFGLSEQQIAHFLSQPSIRNILTRVTGGETSVIRSCLGQRPGIAEWSYESEGSRYFLKLQIMNE